jgi:large subunit ribosomal protein L10
MTRSEKHEFVVELTEQIRSNRNFLVLDIDGFTVEKTSEFRRKCFEAGLKVQTVKNTLLIKALEQVDGSYESLFPALKKPSTLLFIGENPNAPAKMVKAFRESADRPALKGAYVESTVFLGDESLETLIKLKSKAVLLGEIVGLLQSPAKNVISALTGASSKVAGLVEAIGKKKEEAGS